MTSSRLRGRSQRRPGTSIAEGAALSLTEVIHRYGGTTILRGIDLELHAGAVCLLAGSNGSGKTTLLRVAAGLLPPTGGRRMTSGPALYLRPGSGAWEAHSVREALYWTSRLSGTPPERVEWGLRTLGLGPLARRRVGTLSSGQRARLSLGLALCARAALVCLDEPTVHLDGPGVALIRAGIDALSTEGAAVLIATHDAAELVDVADAHTRLDDGVIRRVDVDS